ncbi:MAG: amidohydrolase [Negativicutes bacterium]|nr:amidohydrolase [Negativicutes bacterium]
MEARIQQAVKNIQPQLISWRRDFHKYPETGWTEFRTAAIVAARLLALGYTVKTGPEAVVAEDMMGVPAEKEIARHMDRAIAQGADAGLVQRMAGGLTGIVADLRCGEGPMVAIRFDMDANDIDEAQDTKHRPWRDGFASVNQGAAHACGHDGHVAMGLGVAEILAGLKAELKGTIRLIFEPGEEGSRGARAMVNAGAVDGVDYILGCHIGFQAQKTGQLICATGKFLATTKYDVKYTGTPAHAGAAPEEGRNALLAAATAALNLHAIARHGQGATRITVGTLVAGQGRNIIPPNALYKMETRGETSELDEYMAAEARRIIVAAAEMYGVEYEIVQMGGTKSGESSPDMRDRVKEAAARMDFFHDIVDYASFGATEDYSHFMTVVQDGGGSGTYFMVGADMTAGHHNNYFDFDEAVLAPGVELILRTVAGLLR